MIWSRSRFYASSVVTCQVVLGHYFTMAEGKQSKKKAGSSETAAAARIGSPAIPDPKRGKKDASTKADGKAASKKEASGAGAVGISKKASAKKETSAPHKDAAGTTSMCWVFLSQVIQALKSKFAAYGFADAIASTLAGGSNLDQSISSLFTVTSAVPVVVPKLVVIPGAAQVFDDLCFLSMGDLAIHNPPICTFLFVQSDAAPSNKRRAADDSGSGSRMLILHTRHSSFSYQAFCGAHIQYMAE